MKISNRAFCFLSIKIKYDAGRSDITYLSLKKSQRWSCKLKKGQMTWEEVPLEGISILSSVHFHDGIVWLNLGGENKLPSFPLKNCWTMHLRRWLDLIVSKDYNLWRSNKDSIQVFLLSIFHAFYSCLQRSRTRDTSQTLHVFHSFIHTYIHTYVYWPLPQRGFSVPITKEKIKIKTYTNNLKLQLQIIRISFLPLKFV